MPTKGTVVSGYLITGVIFIYLGVVANGNSNFLAQGKNYFMKDK
jgi:hypothetical protein